jgi:hypothetical protein
MQEVWAQAEEALLQCINCGDFYCHYTEQGACRCFWAHMCNKVLGSGMPTATGRIDFPKWGEEKPVQKCSKVDDAKN